MNTSLTNTLVSTESKRARYDAYAKQILAHKNILAHILKGTISEFKEMDIEAIVESIEGEPKVSEDTVDSGQTDAQIIGRNTEDSKPGEGMIRFDIIFHVCVGEYLSRVIVNVEVQKDEPSRYAILNRAIYYVSRLVSSQKEREFTRMDYDSIKRVYSIWLCLNAAESTISHIHLTQNKIMGNPDWKGDLDIMNIIMVGITNDLPERDEKYDMHRLLSALMSNKLEPVSKIKLLQDEYGIQAETNFSEDVREMCNLGESIYQEAREEGREEGRKVGIEKGVEVGKEESMRNTISLLREMGLSDAEIIDKMCKNFTSPLEVIEKLVTESCISKTNDALDYLDGLTR